MNDMTLFKVSQPWNFIKLHEACLLGGGNIQTGPFGSLLHASDYISTGFGIPSIMPQNIGDNRVIEENISRISITDARRLSKYLVKTGDIVYSRRGDVERRALIREREDGWLCGTGCLRIRFSADFVDPQYASYYLGHLSVRKWIVQHAHGATMPNLNTSILGELPFLLPPLPDQKAIAHVLGSLDDKIELNRQTNQTLEEMARALFKEWFIDFGPVRAKMRGEQPIGLSAELASLFPDRLDNEGVPLGWKRGILKEIIHFNPTERIIKGEQASYIDMASLPTQGSWPALPIKRVFNSGMKFRNNDALFARITPCLENGKAAFIQCLEDNEVAWGSTEFIVMRAKDQAPPEIAYLLTRDSGFREYAIQNMSGTSGRQRVQADILERYPFVIPTDQIWTAFSSCIRPWFALIKSNSLQINTLAQMRDLLLPKLLSGQIRVQEAETMLEQAV